MSKKNINCGFDAFVQCRHLIQRDERIKQLRKAMESILANCAASHLCPRDKNGAVELITKTAQKALQVEEKPNGQS